MLRLSVAISLPVMEGDRPNGNEELATGCRRRSIDEAAPALERL
jgi:hypothetical protein